jgi:uncharacterized iron-regulated membrane protein
MTKSTRFLFFKVHSWVGAQLFFVMFVIISTGTLAVVSNEIDWLARSEMRAPATNAPVSWQMVHDNVQRAFPTNDIQGLAAPVEPGFAIEVMTLAPNGAYERIYVDPGSGAVQGSHGWITVQRFLRNMHMGLFLPEIGIYVVSGFGIFLLGTLITGLVAYKKFWRGFARKPRDRDTRTLIGDLHRLGGIWSIWFILFIAVTGIWYLVESSADYGWERKAPGVSTVRTDADGAVTMITVDQITQIVRQNWPTFEIDYINLAETAGAPITVGGHAEAKLVRSRGNLIYIHPVSGEVLRIKDATEVALIERWIDTADPLHFGDFGGLITKFIWFMFGLILSFLSFSGFWLSLRRARGLVPPTVGQSVQLVPAE